MDKFTDNLARKWVRIEDSIDNLFQRRLLRTFNSTFIFLIGFIALVGVLISILFSFKSISDRILFFLGYVAIAFVGLTIVATHIKRKTIKQKRMYPFNFQKIDFNLVDYDILKFDKQEKIDFILLLNRRKVQNKLNFKETNKSKESASHPKLFSMFHILLKGGISDFKDKRLKLFFEMLQDSFLMNGKDINLGTLKTSFANWKGDLDSSRIKDYNQYYEGIFKIEK